MITGTKTVGEINEAATLNQNNNVMDEIKRNHLQSLEIEQVSRKITKTNFSVKFTRLKRSLRKRSSNIF